MQPARQEMSDPTSPMPNSALTVLVIPHSHRDLFSRHGRREDASRHKSHEKSEWPHDNCQEPSPVPATRAGGFQDLRRSGSCGRSEEIGRRGSSS